MISRARINAWRRQSSEDAERRRVRPVGFDSRTTGYKEKLPADHPDYAQRVAVPVMNAVDGLPPEYRAMVHEFGYVDVYRAWLHRVPPAEIMRRAEQTGGIYFYGTA